MVPRTPSARWVVTAHAAHLTAHIRGRRSTATSHDVTVALHFTSIRVNEPITSFELELFPFFFLIVDCDVHDDVLISEHDDVLSVLQLLHYSSIL